MVIASRSTIQTSSRNVKSSNEHVGTAAPSASSGQALAVRRAQPGSSGDASQTYSSSRASHQSSGHRANRMNLNFGKFWESVHHMADTLISRLPSLSIKHRVGSLLRPQHFHQPNDPPRHAQTPAKSGDGFRAVGGSKHHLAGLTGRCLHRGPIFSGQRSDQSAGRRRCGDWLRLSEYPAEFSDRNLVVMGGASAYGQQRELYRVLYAVPSVGHRSEPLCKLLTPG